MTKIHFVQLARVIAATADMAERSRLAREVGEVCASVNPQFRWSTWLAACGVEG